MAQGGTAGPAGLQLHITDLSLTGMDLVMLAANPNHSPHKVMSLHKP